MAYVGQRKPGYEVKRGKRASREVKGGEAQKSFVYRERMNKIRYTLLSINVATSSAGILNMYMNHGLSVEQHFTTTATTTTTAPRSHRT